MAHSIFQTNAAENLQIIKSYFNKGFHLLDTFTQLLKSWISSKYFAQTNSPAQEGANNPMVHISTVFPGSRGLPKAVCVGLQASSRPTTLKHPCCELGFPSSLPTGSNTDHHLLASFYSPINFKLPKPGTNLLVLHLHIFQLTIPITYSNAQTQWLPAGPSTAGHLFVLLYSVYVQGRGFWWGVQAQPLLHDSHGILPYTSIKLQLQHTMTGYSSLF